MIDENADAITRLTARICDLEARYTHAQRTVEELNEVVVEQSKRLDTLQRKLVMLGDRFDSFATHEVEPRTLEGDKPPHY
jgi:uncharacterized coiled-coil protein SlyX